MREGEFGRSHATPALAYPIRRIYDSAIFQGSSFRRGYFEGWYFKLTDARGDTFAIIPGVSVTRSGERHAFIQSIDGRSAKTRYTALNIDEFSFSKNRFEVRIGGSLFTRHGIDLSLDGPDHRITGSVSFDGVVGIAPTLLSPGIMGWYRYVPFMECYHGVVSVDHRLSGSLVFGDEAIDFSGGRGYIEKDWGTSFPSSWIWMQTNNFEQPGVSFMLSIAKIPWLRRSFVGFLSFLRYPQATMRFATYTGASIRELSVDNTGVSVVLESKDKRAGVLGQGCGKERSQLTIRATKGAPGGLKAPVEGAMDRTIAESVSATIELALDGPLSFHGTGVSGGLEIAEDIGELIAKPGEGAHNA